MAPEELTPEQNRELRDVCRLIRKSASTVVEARISAEMGAETAAKVISKVECLADMGMSQDEIRAALRNDPELQVPQAAAALAIAVAALALSTSSCASPK